ncbi:MAG TPA: response regulator transcription factor [Candidatus Dormibacteraeota bacterium]
MVRVLIVDDQEPFRLAARMVVELTDGFEVAGEVESGEASIDVIADLHPDLVLMDVNLPGIDGLEATRRIMSGVHEGRPVIVLVLSTHEAPEYEQQSLAAGAASFIPKSEFSPDRLAAAWREAHAPA